MPGVREAKSRAPELSLWRHSPNQRHRLVIATTTPRLQTPWTSPDLRGLPRAVGIVISLAAIGVLVWTFDLGAVLRTAIVIPPAVLLLSVLALFAGLVLSSIRYQRILEGLGLRIPLRLAFHANLAGIIGGLVFFQLLGQTLARSAVLSRCGVGGPSVLVANVYERVTAFVPLFIMAVGSALYLFGSISFDRVGGVPGLIKLMLALLLVALALALFGCRRLFTLGLRRVMQGNNALGAIRISGISVVLHASTVVAFTTLTRALAPDVPITDLVAASFIVMFAASVPISFAGWGVREISAVYAYGMLGIGADKALAVSILIGLMSLLLVSVLGALSLMAPPHAQWQKIHRQRDSALRRSLQIERSVSWFVPILAAALVFFQVHLPIGESLVNVNLADPVAIGGGFIFLARYLSLDERARAWQVSGLEAMLLAMTIAVTFALLNGWARFGLSDWALYNRFFGWFVLLGYFGTGALIVGAGGGAGRSVLLRSVLAAAVAITVLDFGILAGGSVGLPLTLFLPQLNFAGMAQNVNAYAVQITVAIAIFCALQGRHKGVQAGSWTSILVLAILIQGIVNSGSRSGLLVGSIVLLVALALRSIALKMVLLATAIAVAILATPTVLHALSQHSILQLPHSLLQLPAAANGLGNMLRPSADAERWFTIWRGLQLWIEHPVLGSGLGAFVTAVQAERGQFLVIHNSPIWLLAEVGLVGFLIFALAFAAVARASLAAALRGEILGADAAAGAGGVRDLPTPPRRALSAHLLARVRRDTDRRPMGQIGRPRTRNQDWPIAGSRTDARVTQRRASQGWATAAPISVRGRRRIWEAISIEGRTVSMPKPLPARISR